MVEVKTYKQILTDQLNFSNNGVWAGKLYDQGPDQTQLIW